MKRLLPLALALSACGVDPAPADIDGILKWLWINYDVADDAQVADAVAKLDKAFLAANDEVRGRIGELTAEEAAIVEPAARGEIARARGAAVMDIVECPFSKSEQLAVALDQKSIYGGYDTYTRVYTSDIDAYRRRSPPFINWSTDYRVDTFGVFYDAKVIGGARFVPKVEGATTAVFLQRAWLAEPAKFSNSDDHFTQDYQIHVMYERTPGQTIRVTTFWRDMKFAGYDMDGDVLVQFQLTGMKTANRKMEESCGLVTGPDARVTASVPQSSLPARRQR